MNRRLRSGLSAASMSLHRAVCAREMVSLADMFFLGGGGGLMVCGNGCIRFGIVWICVWDLQLMYSGTQGEVGCVVDVDKEIVRSVITSGLINEFQADTWPIMISEGVVVMVQAV
ncbi:hypothetical protein HYFRA_00011739 [Hymenoscyphus fraxineus]|uniref:Uncharacterized protein n=1 Tax=Hymenoscyphus fraxineus TaxID=746836 RepID=A0A9N9PWY7_9HELO|nr:hypothetical protein HYFRA_00011739 [Hymenoscyphus fraxineus]